jgi:hypothetical protein
MSILNKVIFGTAFTLSAIGTTAVIAPSLLQQATTGAFSAVKDTVTEARIEQLKSECNKDWGPSTQDIKGYKVPCNMPSRTMTI